MPFVYNAGTWTPKTAAQHTNQLLVDINAQLSANGVLDSQGNAMVLQPIASNAIWILCLAIGAMRAGDDQTLLAAAQMFSISQCSTQQLQEILSIIGTSLISGQYSLVVLQVTADSTGATVPAGTAAAYGSICNFVTLATATVPASGTVNILAQANVIGPIAVAPGLLTSFTTSIPHVTAVTNPAASIIGRNLETYPQLRQRILSGNVVNVGLNGASLGLQNIQGITASRIYFNPSPTAALVLTGGTSIPARTAYLLIVGADNTGAAIAAAYAAAMNAPTLPFGTTAYTRTDISFAPADNSINTVAGNFVTAGFAVGQFIGVTGSASNNFTGGYITSVTANKIIVSQVTIVTEASGASDTLTLLPAQAFVSLGGQIFPVYYRVAPFQQVYVQVKYDPNQPVQTGAASAVQAAVSAMLLGIGQPVTAAMSDQTLAGFAYAAITASQVSTMMGTTYVRTDLTFASAGNTITTAAGNFLTNGFAVGQFVKVTGSASNNFVGGYITVLTATVMTLSIVTLVNESDSNSITLTTGTWGNEAAVNGDSMPQIAAANVAVVAGP
jgi:hypothetical protein